MIVDSILDLSLGKLPVNGYPGARFHHNLVENLQGDGLYLSPMYPRHRLENRTLGGCC